MKIVNIELTDFGQFEQLEIKPGAVTILSGTNGEGKSTLLAALLGIFQGGHSPQFIRDYGKPEAAKKATVKLTLDTGVVIKKVTTHKASTLTVETEDGQPVDETPAAFVKKLASGFSLDPISFVEAGKAGAAGWKERQKFLQVAIPTTFTAAEVEGCGCDLDQSERGKLYDIESFDALLKDRYERRTSVNTKTEQCDATVAMLTKSLPGESETTDWAAEAKALKQDIAEGESVIKAECALIDKQANENIEEARKQFDAYCADVRQTAVQELERVRAAAKPMMDEKTAALAVAQERAKASAAVDATKGNIENVRAQKKALVKDRLALERAVEGLRELKKRKLDSSPIEGLEIRDGQIYYEGKNFDTQLNTAKQFELAFALCSLAPGSLGLMVCDKAECMEEETTFAAFKEAAVLSGFQIFIARVSSGKLAVETIGA